MLLFMAMKEMKYKIMATNHDTVIGADQHGVQDIYGVQMKLFTMMCEARQVL